MDISLPPELVKGAILRGKEFVWELSAFPNAAKNAPALGYACLGGQFWFILPDNTVYEIYWLEVNSNDKASDESWLEFASRSCFEVQSRFKALMIESDFIEEVKKFESFALVDETAKSKMSLLFNAYFVTEQEFSSLGLKAQSGAQ
jgi:hypothetical protein